MSAGTNGLLNAAVKPVAVGVNRETVRPRTVMALLVPVMVGVVETVSVAVIVWLPALLSVALKIPMPPDRLGSAGRLALAALVVKWTSPL